MGDLFIIFYSQSIFGIDLLICHLYIALVCIEYFFSNKTFRSLHLVIQGYDFTLKEGFYTEGT